MEEQRGPGRHQATATSTSARRRKWIHEDNWMVVECYYESVSSKNGYRKIILQLWLQKDRFHVTQQRLVDQADQIRKKKWLNDLELEEIRRAINDESKYIYDKVTMNTRRICY